MVRCVSANYPNLAFHPSRAGKCVFTWIMEVETIKMADWGYVQLYGLQAKVRDCGLGLWP